MSYGHFIEAVAVVVGRDGEGIWRGEALKYENRGKS